MQNTINIPDNKWWKGVVLSIKANYHHPKGSNPHRPSFNSGIWYEGTWVDGTWFFEANKIHPESYWLNGIWIKGDCYRRHGRQNYGYSLLKVSPKCCYRPINTLSLNYAEYKNN